MLCYTTGKHTLLCIILNTCMSSLTNLHGCTHVCDLRPIASVLCQIHGILSTLPGALIHGVSYDTEVGHLSTLGSTLAAPRCSVGLPHSLIMDNSIECWLLTLSTCICRLMSRLTAWPMTTLRCLYGNEGSSPRDSLLPIRSLSVQLVINYIGR